MIVRWVCNRCGRFLAGADVSPAPLDPTLYGLAPCDRCGDTVGCVARGFRILRRGRQPRLPGVRRRRVVAVASVEGVQ